MFSLHFILVYIFFFISRCMFHAIDLISKCQYRIRYRPSIWYTDMNKLWLHNHVKMTVIFTKRQEFIPLSSKDSR